MAVGQWDESKHKRGQPENKGEFGPGGGGASSKQLVATPEGIVAVKKKFPELFKKVNDPKKAAKNKAAIDFWVRHEYEDRKIKEDEARQEKEKEKKIESRKASEKTKSPLKEEEHSDLFQRFAPGTKPSIKKFEEPKSKEFKRWFGNSKVVDKKGNPLVVYHGTITPGFTFFRKESHFGSQAAALHRLGQAEIDAENKFDSEEEIEKYLAKRRDALYPVYLSIQNPKRVQDVMTPEDWHYVAAQAKKEGHDGLVYENEVEGGKSWVIFEPTQVKSASDHGGFDPNNKSINASELSLAIRAEQLARRIEKVLASGSEVGHEFRGNQWTVTKIAHSEGKQVYGIKSDHQDGYDLYGHKVIGHLHLFKDEDDKWAVGKVNVVESHRRKGVATTLLRHAEKEHGFVREGTLHTKLGRLFRDSINKNQNAGKIQARDSNRTAKAVVHDEAGNVLVIKDATHGTWDLPGGHLHEGESLDQGLHREVKEETGLEIIGESWRANVNEGRTELFDTQVAGIKPRVTLSPEHTAFKWVEPAKAEELAAFWFQDPSANALGSSRAGFYPQTGPTGLPGHQNAPLARERVRQEAEIEVAKAVSRVVTLAEAEVLAGKADNDDFWAYAAVAFFGAIMAAYGQTASELAVLEGQDSRADDAESKAHAEQRAELLKDFPKRVKARLEEELKQGQAAGETEAELHKRIGLAGDKILQGEGRVVAETEAQAMAGSATLRLLKRAGFETAFWVTVGDDHVRETHLANEAQGEVKLGDKFSNGCRFPGDPKAPLEETINCRCVLIGASRKKQE